MRISRQMLGIAAASMLGLTATAGAQQIDFHGGAVGCFVTTASPITPCPVAASDATTGGAGTLTYNSDTFTGTTSGVSFFNNVGFGNALTGCPTGSCGSFGTVFTTGDYQQAPGAVWLELTFIFDPNYGTGPSFPGTPTVTGNPFVTSVSVIGAVSGGVGGGIIDFTNSSVDFLFSNGNHAASCQGLTPTCFNVGPFSGTADLTVATRPFGATQSADIGGNITVLSTTPEPATIALFATGLVGLIPVARRRKSSKI